MFQLMQQGWEVNCCLLAPLQVWTRLGQQGNKDKQKHRKLGLCGLPSLWRRHSILEAQCIYFTELNKEDGLLHTAGSRGNVGLASFSRSSSVGSGLQALNIPEKKGFGVHFLHTQQLGPEGKPSEPHFPRGDILPFSHGS